MPTEVISTIHQLGDNRIIFTKKYSNIIHDMNNLKTDINEHGKIEITGVENTKLTMIQKVTLQGMTYYRSAI